MFTKVSQGIQKLSNQTTEAVKILSDPNKVKEKILDGQTANEVATFSSLWEIPEPVEYCRGCENKFSTRKHHCRSCAGVFCDDCCPSIVPNSSFEQALIPSTLQIAQGQPVRICQGCRRGECPSRNLIDLVRKRLDDELQAAAAQSSTSSLTTLEKLQHKMALKVSEIIGKLGDDEGPGSRHLGLYQIKLHRGSFYGENGLVRKAGTARAVAMSGYFEFYNKSKEVVALKLIQSTENALFELPRPSYIAVAPGDAVYAFFEPASVESLDLIVLCDNPNPIPRDRAILYDTRAHGAHPERISPCARINENCRALAYHIDCRGKNVVLKYKGNGAVLPREGNAAQRVGVLGWIQNRRYAENLLDLSTNIGLSCCTVSFVVK